MRTKVKNILSTAICKLRLRILHSSSPYLNLIRLRRWLRISARSLILIFAGLILIPNIAMAHGGLWASQYTNWLDGVQWRVVFSAIGITTVMYLIFRATICKLRKIDILDHFGLRAFLKSSFYPLIFQLGALVIFAVIFYYLFFGSYYYSENPGSILVWTFWWAVLPFSFILVGRLWCAICPFAWISDTVQKLFGRKRPVPPWLIKYSFWIVDGTFLFVTWFDRVYGMTERPFVTGLVFAGLFIGVVVCGALYERRVFCRYVCFLGNVAGTYSMTAPIEFKAKDEEVCKSCKEKFCFFGRQGKPGCPFYQVIPSKEGNRFCTGCGNCVKACPYDNVAVSFRPFGTDFWRRSFVRFEESFFAKMLVGVVILQNIGMLSLWTLLSDFVQKWTGITNQTALFTLIYLITVSAPLLLMFAASALSAKAGKEKILQNFARFGYAFVAVDLAGHLAHNLNHFIGEGKTVLAAVAGIFSGEVRQIIFQWFLNYGTVRFLQYFVLILGLIGTLAITYKIAARTAKTKKELILGMAPHIILLIALIALNFYIFSLPMMHRSQNII